MLPALRNRGPGHPVDTAQAPSQEILGQGCLWWPLLLRFLLNMKPVGSYFGASPPSTTRSCPSGGALWDNDVTEKPRAGVRGELRRSHLNSGSFTEDGALRQRPCKCGVFPESEAHKHRRRPPALSLQAPSPCPPHPSGSLIIYLACQYLQKKLMEKKRFCCPVLAQTARVPDEKTKGRKCHAHRGKSPASCLLGAFCSFMGNERIV